MGLTGLGLGLGGLGTGLDNITSDTLMSHLFVLLSRLGALLIAVLALYTVQLRSDKLEHHVHYLIRY